jgi:hypothetical protein
VLGEGPVEVDQVLAVPAHLLDRVEDRLRVGVDLTKDGIVLVRSGLAPLLQLDNDVGRLPGNRMHSGEYGVGTLAVQRQRVLQHHLHVTETGVVQGRGQGGNAAPPGSGLGGPGPVTMRVNKLLGEVQEERAVERHDGNRPG